MAEYFGYVERNAEDYVNWGQIGKNLTEMLSETKRVREQKKKEIDDANDKFTSFIIDNMPVGEHKGAKDAAMDLANQVQNQMLLQTKLMKTGALNPEDFVRKRENLNSDLKITYSTLQDLQKRYKDITDGVESQKLSTANIDIMAFFEEMTNFTKNGIYINPNTSRLVLAEKAKSVDENGNIKYGPPADFSKVTSVKALNGLLNTNIARIDLQPQLDTYAKNIGTTVQDLVNRVNSYTGEVTSFTNILNPNNKFNEDINKKIQTVNNALNGFADATVSNPMSAISIAKDHMRVASNGKPYVLVQNPGNRDLEPNEIAMVGDASSGYNIPKFTDNQINEIKEYVKDQVKSKIDTKVQEQPYNVQQKQERQFNINEAEWNQKKKQQGDLGEILASLYKGNYTEKTSALQTLANILGDPSPQLLPNNDGYSFKRSDGSIVKIKLKDNGNVIAFDDYLKQGNAAVNASQGDFETIKKKGLAKYNRLKGSAGEIITISPQSSNIDEGKIKQFVKSKVGIDQSNITNSVAKLNATFSNSTGLNFSEDDGSIVIKNKVGSEIGRVKVEGVTKKFGKPNPWSPDSASNPNNIINDLIMNSLNDNDKKNLNTLLGGTSDDLAPR